MTHSEAATRSALIDKALGLSSWNVKDPTQVIEEFDIAVGFAPGGKETRTPYEGTPFIVQAYEGLRS